MSESEWGLVDQVGYVLAGLAIAGLLALPQYFQANPLPVPAVDQPIVAIVLGQIVAWSTSCLMSWRASHQANAPVVPTAVTRIAAFKTPTTSAVDEAAPKN